VRSGDKRAVPRFWEQIAHVGTPLIEPKPEHRGSFLRSAEDSLTGTLLLVPQIADTVNVPVIAAGGIADPRGLIAAFARGAEAVRIGTAFLASEQSGSSKVHREAYCKERHNTPG